MREEGNAAWAGGIRVCPPARALASNPSSSRVPASTPAGTLHLPQYLHSDLVLPSGHTLQAIVRAATPTALHSHTAGHQLFGHSAHELHSQGHHHFPWLTGGTSIHVYP